MADERTFRLRITYEKIGRLALLSHLEVTRTLTRIVRRAGLPFSVTNGFSPHMRIAFGSALPVGVGGLMEYTDVYLRDYIAAHKALDALSAASPEHLRVYDAIYVEPKAPAVSVAFPLSTYEIAFASDSVTWNVPPTIEVVRKKKTKELVTADYLVDGPRQVFGDSPGDGEAGSALPAMEAYVRYRFTLQARESGSLRVDSFCVASLGDMVSGGLWSPESPVRAITRVRQSAFL